MRRISIDPRIACAVACLSAAPAFAAEAPFSTGRFVSDGREVFAGLFMNDVDIDAVTLGSATFLASMQELIEPLSVRVSIDTDGDGVFELLSDEQLRSGRFPVSLALGLGLDPEKYSTALEAMQGLSLAHMLYTDGSVPVQVDVLLVLSLYDDKPAEDDSAPECIVLGSIDAHRVSAAAIIGGNADEPILARDPVAISNASFVTGGTGIDMMIRQTANTHAITMVGLDLSGDLAVEEGVQALGYRVTIGPGKPAMFNVLGAGAEGQRVLAQNVPLTPDIEDFLLGALFGSGWASGGSVFRVPGVTETPLFLARVPLDFRGDGGGGGGGGPRPLTPPPPPLDPEDPIVPAPSALAALGIAALLSRRRRREN